MDVWRTTFKKQLDAAVKFHGHLCLGQVIGVRMGMLGLRSVGISDPYGKDRKKLIVFVEIARCATDAIMTVTGARVGRRSLKVIDNGKMAASFYNLETGLAVRVAPVPGIEDLSREMFPELDAKAAPMHAFKELSDDKLFTIRPVNILLKDEDMPGPPVRTVRCVICGENVLDARDVRHGGQTFCKSCAQENAYYVLPPDYRNTYQEAICP